MVTTPPNSFASVLARVQRSATIAQADGLRQLTFHAMNTLCRVHFVSGDARRAADFQQEVLRWIAWFEAQYSRFIPDSLIGRINAAAGEHWVDVDDETEALFKLCGEMNFFTGGAFDPSALPLIRLWNWKAHPAVIPNDAAIAAARELVGWSRVQRRPGAVFLPRAGMCLDLGGIGKEYAVDRVVVMALQHGFPDVLADFGQDVRVNGKPPGKPAWHIGLEDPQSPGTCWTGVAVSQHAVATSGDYLRHFTRDGRRFGHIIDPRNGQPVFNRCLSVSVIAPTCTVAGILTTSAFILGERDGFNLISLCPGVEGCITTDNSRHPTRKFHDYTTR